MNSIKRLLITAALLLVHGITLAGGALTVYKSPTCGCCNDWVKHLQANGMNVTSHNTDNMDQVKAALGIKPGLASCHTAEVEGYVIEGHVPAHEIERLLSEKPDIAGLAVPGMPMGAPGMEGASKDSYEVLMFDAQGNSSVYATY